MTDKEFVMQHYPKSFCRKPEYSPYKYAIENIIKEYEENNMYSIIGITLGVSDLSADDAWKNAKEKINQQPK